MNNREGLFTVRGGTEIILDVKNAEKNVSCSWNIVSSEEMTNERWGEKLCVTKKKLFIPQHSKKMKKIILPPRAAIAALLLD